MGWNKYMHAPFVGTNLAGYIAEMVSELVKNGVVKWIWKACMAALKRVSVPNDWTKVVTDPLSKKVKGVKMIVRIIQEQVFST